jgi:hypothetical protein
MTSDEIDARIRELEAAGWAPVRPTVWRAPDGRLFVGPAQAWQALQREKGPQA